MPVLTNSDRSVLKATYVTLKSNAATTPADATGRAMDKANLVRNIRLQTGEVDKVRATPGPSPGGPAISNAVWQALKQFEPQPLPILAPKPSILAPLPSDQLAAAARAVLAVRTQELKAITAPPAPAPAPPASGPTSPAPGTPVPPAPVGGPPPAPPLPGGIPGQALENLPANPPPPAKTIVAAALNSAGAGAAATTLASPMSLSQVGTYQSLVTYAAGAVKAFDSLVPPTQVGMLHLERIEMQPAGIERGELVATIPMAPTEVTNVVQKEWSVTSQEFSSIVTDFLENYSEKGVTEKTDLAESAESQTKHSEQMGLNASVSGSYGGFVTFATSASFNTSSSDDETKKSSRDHATEVTQKASTRVRKEHKVTIQTSSVMGKEQTSTRTLTNPSTTETMRIDYFSMMRKWRVRLLRYGLRMTYDLAIPEPGATLRALHAQLADLEQQVSSPFVFGLDPSKINASDPADKFYYSTLAVNYGAAVEVPKKKPLHPLIATSTIQGTGAGDFPTGSFQINIDEGYQVARASADVLLSFQATDDGQGHNVSGERFLKLAGDGNDGYLMFNNAYAVDKHPKFITQIHNYPTAGGGQVVDFTVDYNADHPGPIYHQQGSLQIHYQTGRVMAGTITFTIELEPSDEWLEQWRQRTWQALYNAKRDTFYTNLQRLTQQRDALKAEIENVDTLTLRREEREEIMKSVLRWLLGPEFDFMPKKVQDLFFEPTSIDPTTMKAITVEQWVQNMSEWFVNDDTHPSPTNWSVMYMYGEMVKFIMEAIEWENLLYILYPYFWDIPFVWDFVRRLQHPDSTRESFLRAGSARVVLTIRPGWESDFYAFVENGEFGQQLAKDHPYMTISDELQAYANTNYPGIPPANPETSFRPLLTPRQRSAWQDMQAIIRLLEQYKTKNRAYPTTTMGLAALSTFGTLPAADPWGKPYQYLSPGQYNDYDLSSLGADGAPGGDGENADITSWASASLIGEWFEYTPSHGLDIGITTALAQIA